MARQPVSASKNSFTSAGVRAIGPTWSSERASGKTPVAGMRLKVGLRPLTPQNAAGMRTEPPVSVPSASAAAPVASATPEPPLDPPGTRVGSHGLRQVSKCGLVEVMPHANSCVSVLPITIAPASLARRTASASALGTWPPKILEP